MTALKLPESLRYNKQTRSLGYKVTQGQAAHIKSQPLNPSVGLHSYSRCCCLAPACLPVGQVTSRSNLSLRVRGCPIRKEVGVCEGVLSSNPR